MLPHETAWNSVIDDFRMRRDGRLSLLGCYDDLEERRRVYCVLDGGLADAGSQSNALTPSRLLRLSKNLPHDWKEQRCFLCFAA
jgi:hypothetical protein